MRRTIWFALALLTGCSPSRPILPPLQSGSPQQAVTAPDATDCRAGPDGEPNTTAAAPPRPAQMADRGIGGTGVRPAASQMADRGIGGTGIVGVVTGFASVCLGGREVAFDDTVPVVMDGVPVSAAVLRAGQFTAVEATGGGASLQALRILIRHEVAGPVEEVGVDGVLRVAGQRVVVTERTWTTGTLRVGDWVAVSGLRTPGGEIEATRIDRRVPGAAMIHGLLLLQAGHLRIGALEIRPAAGVRVTPGLNVTASGRYSDGILYADDLAPDLLLVDPVGYFGPAVSMFVVEGYTVSAGGRLRIGPALVLDTPGGVDHFTPLRAVAEFERRTDGTLAVTGLHEATQRRGGPPGEGIGRDLLAPRRGASQEFSPAPTPNRSIAGRSFQTGGNARRPGGFRRATSPAAGSAQDAQGADPSANTPGGNTQGGNSTVATPGIGPGGPGVAGGGDAGFRRR